MKIPFSKYQGCGNDFIILDNRLLNITLSEETIKHLCHRRFGIGADGFISLNPKEGYDFEMVYCNADGRIASMCGNGGRCVVAFANHLGIFEKDTSFEAVDGEHHASVLQKSGESTLVKLQMQDVNNIESLDNAFVLNTGSPHYVCFVENVNQLDVYTLGKTIRYSPKFEKENGVNVNFVKIKETGSLFVRTYERGVEDETLSCGTGVTAAALVYGKLYHQNSINIQTLGGNLTVSFQKASDGKFHDIFLQAEAIHVFDGNIEV